MTSNWIESVAIGSITTAIVCSFVIAIDILRGRSQRMAIMNLVWPITALYLGPFAVWFYWKVSRAPRSDGNAQPMHMNQGHMATDKPYWQKVFVSSTHCGAGCVLGDIIGENAIFLLAIVWFGSPLITSYIVDFALAYLFGIFFQYANIVPMRHLNFTKGIKESVKADTLSLTAFQVGMYSWMAVSYFVLLPSHPQPNSLVFWLSMQIGMIAGFITTYPANWLLIKWGVKEPCV